MLLTERYNRIKFMAFLVDDINNKAERNDLYWVCETAKTFASILKNHLDELHPDARKAVEYYLEEEQK
jgi:hypothetical protein